MYLSNLTADVVKSENFLIFRRLSKWILSYGLCSYLGNRNYSSYLQNQAGNSLQVSRVKPGLFIKKTSKKKERTSEWKRAGLSIQIDNPQPSGPRLTER